MNQEYQLQRIKIPYYLNNKGKDISLFTEETRKNVVAKKDDFINSVHLYLLIIIYNTAH